MARISNPWRAMALVGVFVLAACEPGADGALPLLDKATAGAAATDKSAPPTIAAVLESGVENLIAMTGPTGEDGTLGSGCMIATDEDLPDGDWFAFVVKSTAMTATVDVACVYGPDTDQFEAYAADDDVRWSNYVVVNDVVGEQTLRYTADAQAYIAAEQWQPLAISELGDEPVTGGAEGARGLWLRVEDGRIAAVVQPYTKGVASG